MALFQKKGAGQSPIERMGAGPAAGKMQKPPTKKDKGGKSPLQRMAEGGMAGKGPISFTRAGAVAAMRAEHGNKTGLGAKLEDERPKKGAPVPAPSAKKRLAAVEERLEKARARKPHKGMNFGAYEDRDD